jgi:hypothetical protein
MSAKEGVPTACSCLQRLLAICFITGPLFGGLQTSCVSDVTDKTVTWMDVQRKRQKPWKMHHRVRFGGVNHQGVKSVVVVGHLEKEGVQRLSERRRHLSFNQAREAGIKFNRSDKSKGEQVRQWIRVRMQGLDKQTFG